MLFLELANVSIHSEKDTQNILKTFPDPIGTIYIQILLASALKKTNLTQESSIDPTTDRASP